MMFCTNMNHLAKQSLYLVFYVNKITISFCSLTEYFLAGKKGRNERGDGERNVYPDTHALSSNCAMLLCVFLSAPRGISSKTGKISIFFIFWFLMVSVLTSPLSRSASSAVKNLLWIETWHF